MRASEGALRQLNEGIEVRVWEKVAAKEEAQVRLVHAQRMETLGQFAGGDIAHDLNNVIQAAGGGAKLIEDAADNPARVRRIVATVHESRTIIPHYRVHGAGRGRLPRQCASWPRRCTAGGGRAQPDPRLLMIRTGSAGPEQLPPLRDAGRS